MEPSEGKAHLAGVVAAAIRREGQHVPFYAVAGPWGHRRLLAVAQAVVADLAAEPVAADAFWQACGFPAGTPRVQEKHGSQ